MNGWQWPRHGGWRSLCVFLVVIVVGCLPGSGESQNDPDMERATESADPHLAESQAPRDPGVASGDQVSRPSALDRYLEFARGAVSGERAREMVASVDPSYRVPGNRFFDETIGGVVEVLEASGYRDEAAAAGSPLTYRIERRELSLPTWEPVRASLAIEGSETPLMELESNIKDVQKTLNEVRAEIDPLAWKARPRPGLKTLRRSLDTRAGRAAFRTAFGALHSAFA